MLKKFTYSVSILIVAADLICGGVEPELDGGEERSPTWLQLTRPHVFGETQCSGRSALYTVYTRHELQQTKQDKGKQKYQYIDKKITKI